MGSIRKRGKSWNAQVRISGWSSFTKSFTSKSDAQKWVAELERKLRSSHLPDAPLGIKMSVRDLLIKYSQEVSPMHKGVVAEKSRLKIIGERWVGDLDIRYLTKQHFIQYRDKRLCKVTGETVRAELRLIGRVIQTAIVKWGIGVPYNPIKDITLPRGSRPRNRRLLEGELELILMNASTQRNVFINPVIEFAIETGMRRSEILNLTWSDVDLTKGFAYLFDTKNGSDRRVPLTKYCREILSKLPRIDHRVFPITANCIHLSWNRIKKKSNITNLRFHDLRHEAISRFFEMGLSVPEVALISGHKDVQQLFRYTHLNPENIYEKYPAF